MWISGSFLQTDGGLGVLGAESAPFRESALQTHGKALIVYVGSRWPIGFVFKTSRIIQAVFKLSREPQQP